ncbi:DUF6223 family protein [Actinopolymorpha alba]|uniref:DUF6223 family protein n=1 Tax=Actinopolymorpha alba TaxID=533267 RepID=UPI002351DB32|nr:DUF6223 family protein [Actinopolymorpha alba]
MSIQRRRPSMSTRRSTEGILMSILHLLVAPAVAHVTVAAGGYGPGSGRFGAIVAGVVGLISLVIGGLALARSAGRFGTGNGRAGAIAAAGVGLSGMVLSVLHLAGSAGGFGTGNGRAGAIVALVVGLIGVNLGGLTLARSRRTG